MCKIKDCKSIETLYNAPNTYYYYLKGGKINNIQGVSKKKVIELYSALARSLYNLQKSFFRRRKDQAFSFRLLSFL